MSKVSPNVKSDKLRSKLLIISALLSYILRMKSIQHPKFYNTVLQAFPGKPAILLQSQLAGHPDSQKSYIALKPLRTIKAFGSTVIETEGESEKKFQSDPWQALKDFRERKKSWLFGYLGYDLKNFTEDLSSYNQPIINTPDLFFMEPEILLAVDQSGRVEKIVGDLDLETIKESSTPRKGVLEGLKSEMEVDEYKNKVLKIKRLISEGDFYEANYSFPMVGEFQGDPFWLFEKMRSINPVPFAAYINTNEFSVCCASPERFLKREGNHIVSEPIKGTAARSDDADEDSALKNKLTSEKNRAENLMIVDLVRHDFSRVAKTGTVRVSKLYDVKTFDTVHQLISTVEADLKEESDSVDVIKACFPMGSMTGAPKIEVMKAIEDMETYRRGIYSGAIGYFQPNGDFDFNVVIRSAIIQNEKLVYPVGGAITSDSDADDEWEETMVKAKTITKIIDDN